MDMDYDNIIASIHMKTDFTVDLVHGEDCSN